MFKIAICDDEQDICSQIYGVLVDCAGTIEEKLKIESFESGKDLHNVLSQGSRFDLIFLDIEMAGMNGVKLGKAVREEFRDEATQLVYISANQKYALELFQNRPLHFLIKPLKKADLCKVLKKALVLKVRQELCFEFVANRVLYRIPHKEILYFESFDKKLILYTVKVKHEFYGKLPEIQEQLVQFGFVQIHKSYLVNYAHIKEVHSGYVVLSSDITLTISKTFKKTALAHFFKLGKE